MKMTFPVSEATAQAHFPVQYPEVLYRKMIQKKEVEILMIQIALMWDLLISRRVLGLHKDREAKWIEILSGYNVDYVKHSTRVKRLVGYGIPDSLRGQVWQYLADSHAYRQPGLFRELLLKERLEIYDVIEKDIQRCYPDHIMFYEANGNGEVEKLSKKAEELGLADKGCFQDAKRLRKKG
ncbi:hypothetical protein K493DRAFT_346593 [Basidiobolus meristosporus CBS 931.73]|uniref:Rab-GAP TBC domain-containing protein n=1 Tax=Basidiobolus meristosporus CBS 931.73 TaxID=1314790 RepID=A0A1Y1YX10_9FUNG|nr:hypothetical protein K493DRAFT_346593 [Basidiobolus meristosporus CBS 931.73]|eukprot:ORY02598.1 hypothetical protein K493DRAFT_346593 [Basidiobolus meristosporus CBS 931.73]